MGKTKVTVTGLPDPKRIFARLQTRAGAAMQRRGAQLVSDARARWPKRSKVYKYTRPHSRDLFRIVFREDGTNLVLVVYNDAEDGPTGEGGTNYIYFIKSWKNGLGGKNVWQTLIRKPAKAINKAFAKDVTEAAREAFSG